VEVVVGEGFLVEVLPRETQIVDDALLRDVFTGKQVSTQETSWWPQSQSNPQFNRL
jgi:hypothetical protein